MDRYCGVTGKPLKHCRVPSGLLLQDLPGRALEEEHRLLCGRLAAAAEEEGGGGLAVAEGAPPVVLPLLPSRGILCPCRSRQVPGWWVPGWRRRRK